MRGQREPAQGLEVQPVKEIAGRPAVLLPRGRILGDVMLGWNMAGIVVLAVAAVRVGSAARLAGARSPCTVSSMTAAR